MLKSNSKNGKKGKEWKGKKRKEKKTGRDARQIKCLTRKVCLHAPLNRTLPKYSGTVTGSYLSAPSGEDENGKTGYCY
ncbi:hypothetical protein [Methanosarcina siciliae]|uniref:hypothetical protein n=1 Tax=Methanosarcina siciliae TaxID=38027 RepID=UPI00064E4B9C|nr:hypothetical protein [Methanosarcina siciliae]